MLIACVIPTYNGRADLARLLDSLRTQTVQFDIFVIDSSSKDGSYELAKERVDDVTLISPEEFNHGGTRQLMVDKYAGYDVYVFLTQDAYLDDPNALANIIAPFVNPAVGAVCGRQLPHVDATPISQHARYYNYPSDVVNKSFADIPMLGIKAAFMSNSFAAYRCQALKSVGGFPLHVIFAEDMYVSAKMLLSGWDIVYAGNAICRHSHNYKIREEFERYFDMGVFHARESWIRRQFGRMGGEGLRYVQSELRFLGFRRIHLWPISIFRNIAKFVGFKLGQNEAILPVFLKRKFSMYKRFWLE